MTETVKELLTRKSVRVFTDEKITDEEKNLILNAALEAPTAGNMTMYSIIDVKSQEIKNALAENCDKQKFIAKAPLVLVFLADCQKWYDIIKSYGKCAPTIEEGDLLLAMQDCIIAAHSAVTAAQSMGIGSCYIGDILENFEKNRELLNLPRFAVPCAMAVFGRPTEQQKNRKKPPRFDLEDVVFTDRYIQKTPEETKAVFDRKLRKDGSDFEAHIKRYSGYKFDSDFKDEMNRSARKIIESWAKGTV